MPANIEVKTLVGGGARNATDIHRIGFQNGNFNSLLGQKVTRSQTRWPSTDDGDLCFHATRPNFPG